jgi:hypothetical protein
VNIQRREAANYIVLLPLDGTKSAVLTSLESECNVSEQALLALEHGVGGSPDCRPNGILLMSMRR